MAENGGISVDEFTRLQNQLIELRTENYDIAERYRKTKDENSSLHERIESKEKELQRFGKIMKLPGLQAFSKNRGKRPYEEVVEENERLMHQMQRHEEDFKLQNKTLLEEVSRLSVERDDLENELKKVRDTRSRELDENDEMRRIKAENTVLHKKLQDYDGRPQVSEDNDQCTLENISKDNSEDGAVSKDFEDGELSNRKLIEDALKGFLKEAVGTVGGDTTNEELNEREKKQIEGLVTELESLSSKNKSPRESSQKTNDMKVKLETEEAENQLLRDQIKEEREKTRTEIENLKLEVAKLTEKMKRKQESYIHLQEEKELLHKEKSRLEEEWIKAKELLVQFQDTSAELEEQVQQLKIENENFKSEVAGLQETLDQCSPEKVSELEHTLKTKNEELTSLKTQFEDSSSLNQDLMSEVQKLSEEKNKVDTEAGQNLELANKRKKLLDELSVERQHELENHKKKLEEIKNDNEENKKHLETTLSDLEKAKREVTLANDRHSELLKRFTSIEKKSGWLERTLKETEEQQETERKTHQDLIDKKEEEFQEKLAEVESKHHDEIEALNESKAEVERERDEKISVIEKLNQKVKDKEVEFRISVKKNDQLLKDLKRQLKSERKRADQIQQRLQEFLSETKTRQTFDEIFKHDSSFSKGHRRQDSGSHLSTVSSGSGLEMSVDADANKTSTPLSGTPLSSGSGGDGVKLTNETVELISKVADLQLEKNILEEKVRFLEENSSVMVDDIMRKTEIIQNYVRETKPEMHADSNRRRSMTLKEKMKDSLSIGKHGKSEDMLKEMNAKMQRLLEETLERNIQLQKDVDHLTRELEMKSAAESA